MDLWFFPSFFLNFGGCVLYIVACYTPDFTVTTNTFIQVLSIGEVIQTISLYKNFFLEKSYTSFFKILDWEIFQTIMGIFQENLVWDWG